MKALMGKSIISLSNFLLTYKSPSIFPPYFPLILFLFLSNSFLLSTLINSPNNFNLPFFKILTNVYNIKAPQHVILFLMSSFHFEMCEGKREKVRRNESKVMFQNENNGNRKNIFGHQNRIRKLYFDTDGIENIKTIKK